MSQQKFKMTSSCLSRRVVIDVGYADNYLLIGDPQNGLELLSKF